MNWTLMAFFIIAGFFGAWVGARLARRLPAAQLRQLFALFVIVLGVYLLWDNLPRLFS